jgi:hypothetical protein
MTVDGAWIGEAAFANGHENFRVIARSLWPEVMFITLTDPAIPGQRQ